MMGDITGELESTLASMAHGHAFIRLQGMDFFSVYFFFFFGQRKQSPRTNYWKNLWPFWQNSLLLTQPGFSVLQLLCVTHVLNTSRAKWGSFDSGLNLTLFLAWKRCK